MDKKIPFYCNSLFAYSRNTTNAVNVGNVAIGGENPVRLQSMTTTNTLDAESTANQAISIFKAGGELVRITTQGRREASALQNIKEIISSKGYNFPLVADIHFNPSAANLAASIVEKVRINPGNFTGGAKKFRDIKYSQQEYAAEIDEVKEKLRPFIDVCKINNTALRIGANHGSLSDRIMAYYGDTPLGMVESCMEYLRICKEENFNNVVLSIKSSNTRVMVHTVRLLAATMKSEMMKYPLHLGVTEAGSGEDGRLKSAVGIGALMLDGLGDTIRVSLTEEPEAEIPVALLLRNHFEKLEGHEAIKETDITTFHPYEYKKRESHQVGCFGGSNAPAVVLKVNKIAEETKLQPEAIIVETNCVDVPNSWNGVVKLIPTSSFSQQSASEREWPIFDCQNIGSSTDSQKRILSICYAELTEDVLNYLKINHNVVLLLNTSHINGTAEQRAFFLVLETNKLTHPVIICRNYNENENSKILAAADVGVLFLDGYGDAISINIPNITQEEMLETNFGILQASRVRFSRTEYISCPGCGRTLFDLQTTSATVTKRTSHLKGLKIAIMGCIVNGIGEMADADYGYVGAGPGMISLFKNRELIVKNISQHEAVERLIDLIKENGDWVEP